MFKLPENISFYEHCAKETGRSISFQDFYKIKQKERLMDRLQKEIAEKAEIGGHKLLKEKQRYKEIMSSGMCTGAMEITVDKYRNCNFLPVSLLRNKREHGLNLEYAFNEVLKTKNKCRMVVLSAGWIPVNPGYIDELRKTISNFNVAIGRLSNQSENEWFTSIFEPMSRTTEFTFHRDRSSQLYIHLHCHLMIVSHKKLGEKWSSFMERIKDFMALKGYKHYCFDEKLENPEECAKYICKFYEEDGKKTPLRYQEDFKKEDDAVKSIEIGLSDLTAEEIATLAAALERLHMTDSYGSFAKMKRHIKKLGKKLVKFKLGEKTEYALAPRQSRALNMAKFSLADEFEKKFPFLHKSIIDQLKENFFNITPELASALTDEQIEEANKCREQLNSCDYRNMLIAEGINKLEFEFGEKSYTPPKNVIAHVSKSVARITPIKEPVITVINPSDLHKGTETTAEGFLSCVEIHERVLDLKPELVKEYYYAWKAYHERVGKIPPMGHTSPIIRRKVSDYGIYKYKDIRFSKDPGSGSMKTPVTNLIENIKVA